MEARSDVSSRTRSSSRPKRKPFSDLTNVNPSSPLLKPKSKPKSQQTPNPKSKSPQPDSRPADPEPAFSSTAGGQENDGDLPSAASTPKSPEAATNSGKDDNNSSDISAISPEVVKAREKGKEKVVEDTPLLSCPPLGRIRSIEENVRLKSHVSIVHKAFTAPRERTKKRKLPHHKTEVKLQKLTLPQDFVEKQKAYFAEIDAFELPVEEASDSDLE